MSNELIYRVYEPDELVQELIDSYNCFYDPVTNALRMSFSIRTSKEALPYTGMYHVLYGDNIDKGHNTLLTSLISYVVRDYKTTPHRFMLVFPV